MNDSTKPYIPLMTVGAVMDFKTPKEPPKKMWQGSQPTTCQLCHNKLMNKFIDGKTIYGPWAIMCLGCHHDKGCGLGTGKGQLYDLKTLEKIGG